MTTATQDNVAKLYIATFGRAPEGAGLNYWINTGMSLEQIAQSFFDQPETKAKYDGTSALDFVKAIYVNVLGREGEAAGVAYWVGELEKGNITRDMAILAVLGGAQGADGILLENRTEVGLYYAKFGDEAPNAFDVITETTAAEESVQKSIDWIDGKIPPEYKPSTYYVLDDNKTDYNLTGSTQDDVFVVEEFKTATIKGGEGSDTLDFQDFSPKGVTVNLSTGLGPVGATGVAMKLEWVENVRGTSGNDTLVGNSDANILVSMGGVDNIDGGVGNDRILFRNVTDVAASIINGGQNTDTLEITDQTEITVDGNTFANVSDVEILQVGYSAEGVASAATITVLDPGAVSPLNTFKEIRGTESYDKKGVPADDVIQSADDLNVSLVKLTSIEEVKATSAAGTATTITVGKDTLTSVKKVTGNAGGDTIIDLAAKNGEVFDLTQPTFTRIDEVTQTTGPVSSTIIVNQSLINSFAANSAVDVSGSVKDGFGAGDFTLSTLRASGIGLDLSVLDDGDTNFKVIEFGTAKEVTIGNVNDAGGAAADLTALRTITGSENDSDLLRIKPNTDNAGADFNQDLTNGGVLTSAIAITKVERLDFEEISTVALANVNLTDVRQISGDNDGKLVDGTPIENDAADANDNGTVIDAGYETAVGGLNLKGKKLESIVGFGNNVSGLDGTVTVNSQTTGLNGIKSLDLDSDQTIIADDAGAYDLSAVASAEQGEVDFDDDANLVLDAASDWVVALDLFKGSAGNDIVKGGVAGFTYDLGKGDDTFIGSNTANELVLGGDGNDNIALGDNNNPTPVVANAGVLINAANNGFNGTTVAAADYVLLANTLATATTGHADATVWGTLYAYADGGAGDDVITSGKANGGVTDGDLLTGGAGNDSLSAGDGNDLLLGGEGHDILSGGKGDDYMLGGEGDDLLEGNAGEDFLIGGKGKDVLRGDELKAGTQTIDYLDRDHFIFEAGDSGTTESTVDIIKDFLGLDLASTLDLDNNGTKGDEARNDVIYHNWFTADDGTGAVTSGANTYALAAALTTVDNTVGPVGGGVDGDAYTTITADIGNTVAGEANLLAAANKALDKVYKDFVYGQLADLEYVSEAVQFEYGGKEYLVVDAFTTRLGAVGDAAELAANQAANNFNATNDLLIQLADAPVSWSVGADDIVVTRWDPPVA